MLIPSSQIVFWKKKKLFTYVYMRIYMYIFRIALFQNMISKPGTDMANSIFRLGPITFGKELFIYKYAFMHANVHMYTYDNAES